MMAFGGIAIGVKTILILGFLHWIRATALDEAAVSVQDKYTVVKKNVNYFAANLACKLDGKELVSIETEEEWNTIVAMLEDLGYGEENGFVLWTSGNSLQAQNSSEFHWMSDGSALPGSASYWGQDEPKCASELAEGCLIIYHFKDFGFKMACFHCYDIRGFICEQN